MNGDFQMGAWLVQPSLNTVSRNGTSVQLEPKVMGVLVCLAEHAGEPVSKEKLLQTVWPDTFVGEGVLTRSISELRRVFQDEAKEPRVIQTIAKRGYRLMVQGSPVNGSHAEAEHHQKSVIAEIQATGTNRAWTLGMAGTVLLLIGLVAILSLGNLRERVWAHTHTPQIHSLAVLPLKNLSGDPSQDYFSDGMTDELITSLSQIGSLRVVSYTSTSKYKDVKKTVPEIAQELGVDGVVEGSVQRVGSQVRVNAQLVYAPLETHLWAQSYDRDLRDALGMQSSVARDIAERIRAQTTAGERKKLEDSRPVNQAALDAYLKAKYYHNSVGEGSSFEESSKAVEYYRDAIRQDPSFAPAYVGIARAYIHFLSPMPQDVAVVKESLDKAMALDPTLAEAHLWTARFKQLYDWDFTGAEQEFKQAIELDPNNAMAHDFYGWFLYTQHRFDEGDREETRAQELDPDNDHLSDGYNFRGQYEQALEIYQRMVSLNPNRGDLRYFLYMAYFRTKRYREAVPELLQTAVLYGHPELAGPLGEAYSKGGINATLRLWAKDLENLQSAGVTPLMVATVYAQLGDASNAFKWLEKGYVERDGWLVALSIDPEWKTIRSDPRFKDLVRRVGLPQ